MVVRERQSGVLTLTHVTNRLIVSHRAPRGTMGPTRGHHVGSTLTLGMLEMVKSSRQSGSVEIQNYFCYTTCQSKTDLPFDSDFPGHCSCCSSYSGFACPLGSVARTGCSLDAPHEGNRSCSSRSLAGCTWAGSCRAAFDEPFTKNQFVRFV